MNNEIKELKEEITRLKDFSNWENHPALKHKVVLDDDFYLSHLYENELIEPDDYEKLKEENKKLKDAMVVVARESFEQKVRSATEKFREAVNDLGEENKKLKEENDVLQKFIAGNYDYEPQVKALISRDWTKEFIENNQERWEEVGLDWGSDDE